MKKDYNFNYIFVMYDIADEDSEVGKNRVNKVFKICKKYLEPFQKSVFKGHITPSQIIDLKYELSQVIDEELDYIAFIKLKNQNAFEEDSLGTPQSKHNSMFL